MTHFDVYGRMADAGVLEVHQNGRHLAQQEGEKFVPADVMQKLCINKDDVFLDIGCGMGLNLFPIANIVKQAVCCDHQNVITKLKNEKKLPANVKTISGNFTELDFGTQKFTKILAYSVVPALPTTEIVYAFVDKALNILSPNGRVLLGDIANTDKKKRFINSKRGKEFQKEWEKLCASLSANDEVAAFRTEKDTAVVMDDEYVLNLIKHIRSSGFHAYIVDQPQNLPFGNTREDILIVGPEYKRED